MPVRPALPFLLLLVVLLTSCGPERRFSGLWQQVCVDQNGDEAACPGGFAYELHLGRYGDGVAGLVVRYKTSRDLGLNLFDPPNECGCFYMAGGKSSDNGLKFTLFEPDTPGRPGPDFEWSGTCLPPGTAAPKPEPDDCVYDLTGDDDRLTANVQCEADDETPTKRTLVFAPVGSSTRTNCVVPDR